MKIYYYQVLDYPRQYPEDLSRRKFSSFKKCSKAVKDIQNRYPNTLASGAFVLSAYIKKYRLEIE